MEYYSNQRDDRKRLIGDVVDLIKDGRIIPIVGDDAYYIKDEDGTEVKLHSYLVDRIIESAEISLEDINRIDWLRPYEDVSCFKQDASNGFKGMTCLSKVLDYKYNKQGKAPKNQLKKALLTLLQDGNIVKNAYLSEDVATFLERGNFPLIVTTSYVDVLEKIVEKHSSVYYFKEGKPEQDIRLDLNGRLETPIIYHLFGKIMQGPTCALAEDDFLQYLHHLHNENTCPQKLIEYVNQKRYLLALGCNIPDWTLRFLLYSFQTPNTVCNEDGDFIGGVLDSKFDEELSDFLNNINYYYEGVDENKSDNVFNSFLRDVTEHLPERISIFVSVYSVDLKDEDIERIIKNIIIQLRQNYSVWFYKHDLDGKAKEDYWGKIQDSLDKCRFFLPIITPNVLDFISINGNSLLPVSEAIYPNPKEDDIKWATEQGFICEWKYAYKVWCNKWKHKDQYCIPICKTVDPGKMQKVFYREGVSEAVASLRRLMYGDDDKGRQIVKKIEDIDFEELLRSYEDE